MIHIALCLRTCSRARSSCSRACSRSFIPSLVAPDVCGAVCVGTRQNLNQGPLHLPGGSCSLPSSVSLASNTSSSECMIGSPPSCMYIGTRKIQRRPRGMPHLHATYPEGVAVPHPRLAASLRAVARRLDHLVVLLDAHLVGMVLMRMRWFWVMVMWYINAVHTQVRTIHPARRLLSPSWAECSRSCKV